MSKTNTNSVKQLKNSGKSGTNHWQNLDILFLKIQPNLQLYIEGLKFVLHSFQLNARQTFLALHSTTYTTARANATMAVILYTAIQKHFRCKAVVSPHSLRQSSNRPCKLIAMEATTTGASKAKRAWQNTDNSGNHKYVYAWPLQLSERSLFPRKLSIKKLL